MNSVAQIDHTFNDLETKPKCKGRPKKQAHAPFVGFTQESISGEYLRVPSIFLGLCAMIDNLAELKVVLYIMRHTWGFREYNAPKRITIDEFVNGRKKADGTRMDFGTGLSKSAVLEGLERAIKHGIVICYADERDQARVKHYYQLKMQSEEQTGPESPETVTTFENSQEYTEDDAVTKEVTPVTFEEQYTEESYTEQLVNDCPEQETEEEYDPYAGTIFSPNYQSPEQKIFVSEAELKTTTEVVKNYHRSSYQLPRTENRTEEPTLRTNDIRMTSTSLNLEEAIRYLPEADQLPKPKAKSPAFIRNYLTSFSQDLGDHDHIPSNIGQAAKIYRQSGLTEEDFIQALYDAREAAKKATQIKHLNSYGNPNRMPYFFRCLARALNPQEETI